MLHPLRPIKVLISPSIPGWSGKSITSVLVYCFSFLLIVCSDLSCQYLRIAALAFPVAADDIQCIDGETFLEIIISTVSPFLSFDCNAASCPFTLHPIAVLPILVCTA